MSVLRPRHNRKTYRIPSENDSDIQEDSADEAAARAERKETGRHVLRPVSNDDEEYAPMLEESTEEEDDTIIDAPADFDPDSFTRRGRKIRWPNGASCDITDVGRVYTTVTLRDKVFVILTTDRMRNLFQTAGKDQSKHMLKRDRWFEDERISEFLPKSSHPVQRRTNKKRVQSNLGAAVRFLRKCHIITLDSFNACFSAALMDVLREEYGDVRLEDIRARLVTLPDCDAYLSTWDGVSVTHDGETTSIEAHDLTGVEQLADLIDIPSPVFVQPPKSTPEMSSDTFEATVERVREFLRTLQEHADWSVIPTQSKEWIVNKLAGQLFLHDEARVHGWEVRKETLLAAPMARLRL